MIRLAQKYDVSSILRVLDAARGIMRADGNLTQWANGYPAEQDILADIEQKIGYVLEKDGEIGAYFALMPSPEPAYSKIYDGEWADDTLPYHVVHRIASYPDVHGIFSSVMDFCFSLDANIRIDTHKDNLIMQHNILKHGFAYCGIICLANGDERLAYQKSVSQAQVSACCLVSAN